MYIIFSLSLSTIFILYVIRNRVVCVTISRPTQTLLLGTAANVTKQTEGSVLYCQIYKFDFDLG